MAGGDISVKVGVDGAADFKKSISEINTTLKTTGTEMALVTSAFKNNENSSKALKAQNKVLADQMGQLAQKADLQKQRLQELEAQGVQPTDKSYQQLVQELNKTETEMNKTAAQIDVNNEKLRNHGMTAEEAHRKHAEAAKAAAEAVMSVASAIGSAVVKLGEMVLGAAKAADELGTMATKTGLSTAELQKMQYAAESIDVSVETITGSMTKLTKQMNSAAKGSGSAADAFAKLGVAVTNDDGTFRDRNEVFNETIAALGTITDETERDAMAMEIFGKSAQELNPLILGGAEALQELGQHAEEAGLIMSEEDVNALTELNNRFDILQQTASMAGNQMLAMFAEPMTEGINDVTGGLERLVKAFKEGGFQELGSEAGKVASELIGKLTQALPDIVKFGTEVVFSLVEGIMGQLPEIITSAIGIITTLVTSLAEELPKLIPVAIDAILTLVDALTDPDNISMIIDAAIQMIIGLATGLIQALPKLIAKAPEIIANLVTALIENLPKLIEAAFQLIVMLGKGIIENLPLLLESCGQIIQCIWDGIVSFATKIWDIGKNIVEGIWQGISNGFEWIKEKIRGWITDVLDFFKNLLGIHSPSTVFADVVGKNMALGIGEGFTDAMEGVERDMMSSIPIPTVEATVNGAEGAAAGVGSGFVEEITIPVIVGDVELARVLYRHIVGEGQRIGPAMVT